MSITRPPVASLLLIAALTACGNGAHTTGAGGSAGTSSTTSATSTGGAGGAGTGGAGTGGVGAGGRPGDPPVVVDLQGRTYDLDVPTGYDSTMAAPLLVEIHGFADAGATMTPWLDEEGANKFAPEADKRGIFLALVHAKVDPVLNRYLWNATDSCCDLDMLGWNDVGYVMAVIQDIESKYNVDPKRIFVFGHSNGAFMANRLACDQADKFAGIVSLAGATYKDQKKCAASAPIAFLQVHGDADMTVPYAGGSPEGIAVLPPAPGAIETTQDWAKKNRCSPKADTSKPPFSVVADLGGNETTPLIFGSGCQDNGTTELWTIHLGPHSPNFSAAWAPAVLDFLMAHPKP